VRSLSSAPDALWTAEPLRRHGFDSAAVAQLIRLRATVEEYQRGNIFPATAQTAVYHAAEPPWFPLAHVRRQLAQRSGTWQDMDFNPTSAIAGLSCPVLLFFGETDEWTPDDSVAIWRHACATRNNPDLTICRLADCGHQPTLNESPTLTAISPQYTNTMLAWLDNQLPGLSTT
jgi:pimeloyl-ACP methyl ester carboxylesterase